MPKSAKDNRTIQYLYTDCHYLTIILQFIILLIKVKNNQSIIGFCRPELKSLTSLICPKQSKTWGFLNQEKLERYFWHLGRWNQPVTVICSIIFFMDWSIMSPPPSSTILWWWQSSFSCKSCRRDIYTFFAAARLAVVSYISSSSSVAFKDSSQQSLPAFVTTKRKLTGRGILQLKEILDLKFKNLCDPAAMQGYKCDIHLGHFSPDHKKPL